MTKTEQNIAIAKLAVDLLKIMESSRSNFPFDGLSDEIDRQTAAPIQAYDAIYARLKEQLIEE